MMQQEGDYYKYGVYKLLRVHCTTNRDWTQNIINVRSVYMKQREEFHYSPH